MQKLLRRPALLTSGLILELLIAIIAPPALSADNPKPESINTTKEIDARAFAAYGMAMDFINAENYTEALVWLEKVLEYDPNSVSACIEAGTIFEEKLNQIDKARQYFERALKIDPENGNAMFGYGKVLVRSGEDEKGIEQLNKAIDSKDAKNKPILAANLYTHLAVLAEQRLEYEKAAENYNKAIELAPNPVYQLMRLAYLYRNTRQYDKSVEVFKRVNKLIPGYARILFEIHETYNQNQQWAEALEYLEKFLGHAYGPGEQPELLQRAADLATKCGKHDVSIKYYERLLMKVTGEHKPETLPPQVAGELARALLQVSHPDSSIPYFKRAISGAAGADKIQLQFDLAVAYFLTKQHDSFITTLKERAAAATPELLVACKIDLAIGYERVGRISEAEETLNSMLDVPESKALAHSHLGMMARRQEKYEEAIKHLTAAVEAAKPGDSANHRLQLAITLEEAGRENDSEQVLIAALQLFPDNNLLNNGLAWFYAQRGIKLSEATTLVEKALKDDPENSYYLDTLGWIYFKLGKNEEALEKLLAAESHDSQSSEILDHIGDVYVVLKNPQKAIEYFRRALKLEPNRKGLEEKIDKLANPEIDK